jgi:hypothetical protein
VQGWAAGVCGDEVGLALGGLQYVGDFLAHEVEVTQGSDHGIAHALAGFFGRSSACRQKADQHHDGTEANDGYLHIHSTFLHATCHTVL